MGEYLLQHNVKMEKEIPKLHIQILVILQMCVNMWYLIELLYLEKS